MLISSVTWVNMADDWDYKIEAEIEARRHNLEDEVMWPADDED
jgi:hypothetical protein